jgi:predicted phosphodiesterase
MKLGKSETWLCLFDVHYPKTDKSTLRAALGFLDKNAVAGVILGGDQLDGECISHHTKGKGLYRQAGAYEKSLTGFDNEVLSQIERRLSPSARKIWIIGNHERFEQDLIEELPELQGTIDHVKSLHLLERDWKVVPLGHSYKIGKLQIAHGEAVGGGMYPARKAVELYGASILIGHTHSPQTFTKISPVDKIQKHQGYVAPIVGNVNPTYLRNKPTAWLNGVVVIETFCGGLFNVIPLVCSQGKFAYGGVVYGR